MTGCDGQRGRGKASAGTAHVQRRPHHLSRQCHQSRPFLQSRAFFPYSFRSTIDAIVSMPAPPPGTHKLTTIHAMFAEAGRERERGGQNYGNRIH